MKARPSTSSSLAKNGFFKGKYVGFESSFLAIVLFSSYLAQIFLIIPISLSQNFIEKSIKFFYMSPRIFKFLLVANPALASLTVCFISWKIFCEYKTFFFLQLLVLFQENVLV